MTMTTTRRLAVASALLGLVVLLTVAPASATTPPTDPTTTSTTSTIPSSVPPSGGIPPRCTWTYYGTVLPCGYIIYDHCDSVTQTTNWPGHKCTLTFRQWCATFPGYPGCAELPPTGSADWLPIAAVTLLLIGVALYTLGRHRRTPGNSPPS